MPDQDWKALAESLTEEALILRLKSTEHDFVERKPRGQKGEWLQTAVAFANSAPIGWPAVLFVGVDDDGRPQQQADKLEDLAKSVTGMLEQAYPPIYRHIVPIDIPGEGACLAVIVPGSRSRPHFAGQSYIRVGPETKQASEEQFTALIAERQSKVYEIRKYLSRTAWLWQVTPPGVEHGYRGMTYSEIVVDDCNVHFASVHDTLGRTTSLPLEWIQLSYDKKEDRLILLIPATNQLWRGSDVSTT